jgi:DNA-binding beta-propeller fold protein YncE
MKNVLLLLLLFFILTEKLVAQYHLIKVWETDSILKVPESVLYSPEHMVLFVSNIDGAKPWEKDGKGSIGKLGLDGKIIAVDWIAGLNAPKGMGLFKNKLYVADITEIVVIDIANAKIIQKIPIANAQRLNDIAIDKKGTIYVSDSKTQKIHQIKKGVATVLLDSLNYPNGLYISNNGLYFLDDGSLYRMEKNKKNTLISKGMEGGTDGIEKVGNEGFLVSCWEGAIWFVDTKGNKELLLDSRNQKINSADIGYDPKNRIVFVPNFWKNKVVAYRLQKFDN